MQLYKRSRRWPNKHTHTKEPKEKRGYLEMGWGTQPQQYAENYSLNTVNGDISKTAKTIRQ